MNTLILLVRTPVAKALGWTLIHFLWEGALIAALIGVGLTLCRPASARTRYGLACFGLLAMLAAFAVTLAVLWPAAVPGLVAPVPHGLRAAPPGADAFPSPPAAPTDWLPWIVPFWVAGVLAFYVRMAGGWLTAERLRQRGTMPAPEEWQGRLRALTVRLRVTRPVILLESCLAETPVLIGFLRPAILIPAGLVTGIAPQQLEAILLHELAHIRRHDYAVNAMQSLVEGLLFYHPAVWWLSNVARAERENCCDDWVVALDGDAMGYAAALAALEERRSVGDPALAATGGNLMKRVRRLLEPERPRSVAGPVLGAILLLAPIAVGLSAWQAKMPAHPAQPVVVAQAQPAQTPRPLAEREQQKNEDKTEKEIQRGETSPYTKWLDEDVAYIITNQERAAFKALTTDAEREKFIEQFWERRDPTPGTPENEFKEEHYRRIAFVNEHFTDPAGVPGWKTDRGRIYISYGPPDEIEDHSNDHPRAYQQWRYRWIEGIGYSVVIEFVDTTGKGEFHMTMDPTEKERLLNLPDAPPNPPHAAVPASVDRDLADLDWEIAATKGTLASLRYVLSEDYPRVRQTESRLNDLESLRVELEARASKAH
jgi:GWxTD domain-containing protein